jgi:hypothetical protein
MMVKAAEKDRNAQSEKYGGGYAIWTTPGRGRETSDMYRDEIQE